MHRTGTACLVAACLFACGGHKSKPALAVSIDAGGRLAAPPTTEAKVAQQTDRRPRLRLSLRSTPNGARATVDGRPAGQTPTIWEVEADGRQHDFTFELPGYQPQRIRFLPVRDLGVVHATLRPIGVDAGEGN